MKTTIQVTGETKALLDEHKEAGETYNHVVQRLAGNPKGELWTEEELIALIEDHE